MREIEDLRAERKCWHPTARAGSCAPVIKERLTASERGGLAIPGGGEPQGSDARFPCKPLGSVRLTEFTHPTRPGRGRAASWTRARRRRTISLGAWLTVESRWSIEARRLEGLLLRVRVDVLAASERGAARRWRACTAPPR